MSASSTLIERNAGSDHRIGLSPGPDLRAVVLTCLDPRVDPAHVLGLGLGEAAVIRNGGGRVTPGVLQNLALLAAVAQEADLGTGFELVVMHHTDCGLSRLAKPEYEGLIGAFLGIGEDEVAHAHLTDPVASVRADVESLRSNPLLPPTLLVSGLVYDVASGRVEEVCPAAPVGASA